MIEVTRKPRPAHFRHVAMGTMQISKEQTTYDGEPALGSLHWEDRGAFDINDGVCSYCTDDFTSHTPSSRACTPI